MPAFLEAPRFNVEVRYGTNGSPEFDTEVVTVTSGAEIRNANWPGGKGNWKVGDAEMNRAELEWLTSFFLERRGRAGGFRFKDWQDFQVTTANGVLGTIVGSTTTMQLQKRYVNGSAKQPVYRDIVKPVEGTVTICDLNGNTIDPMTYSLDYTTGIITITPGWYTWKGEFDVPVRFDSDRLVSEFAAWRDSDGEAMYRITGLNVVEITKPRVY